MDYQASASSGIKRIIVIALLVYVVPSCVTAYTTTNPLDVEIMVSASVPLTPLNNPNQYPDTPPAPPGPVNMVDTTDVAVFKGLAYPNSVISLLKNGGIVTEVSTNINGRFEIRLRNLTQGTYTFGIRAEDQEGRTSKLLTFTIYITRGVTTVVEGIFIPPTITTDKTEVKRGDSITLFGRASPSSQVKLSIYSDSELSPTARSDAQGSWVYTLDSALLSVGNYEGKARSFIENDISPFGDAVFFKVGNRNILRTTPPSLSLFRKRCDLNNDNRVNILDFSIMAFWYKRLGFPEKVDLSSDGKINLSDLSILAYCWTG